MVKKLSLGKEELKGLSDFWDCWIKLLTDKSGDVEALLLKEAVIYQNGEEGILNIVHLACKNHPSLYLEVLGNLQKSHDSVQQLEVGKEALEKVGKRYVLRSEIALKTAEAAILLGENVYVES